MSDISAMTASSPRLSTTSVIQWPTVSPFVASGIRAGTPALTTRGFDADACETVGHCIAEVVDNLGDEAVMAEMSDIVDELCADHPLYE